MQNPSPVSLDPRSLFRLPYLTVLLCGVMWGLTFSLARMATENNAHPIGLAFWQALGGGGALLLICIIRRTPLSLRKKPLTDYTVVALLGTAIPATMYFYAVPHVPVGVLAITVAMVPMMTYALSWSISIDTFTGRRFAGIILGFCAIVLLVGPEASLPDPDAAIWLALPLLASVLYACETVYVDVFVPDNTDMIRLLAGALVTAALGILPLVVSLDAFVPLTYPFDRPEWAIIGMVLLSSLAYVMFLNVVKVSGAVFASITGYVITLCGVFWGMLLFDEVHSAWVWASLLLMLLGMGLVRPRQRGPSTTLLD